MPRSFASFPIIGAVADLPFPDNPTQEGALSPLEAWVWDGSQWIDNTLTPPRYSYVTPDFTTAV